MSGRYDFIVAGGGLAGLSLAYHFVSSPLRKASILIVEPARKDQNDRTFSFWTSRPTLFDPIVCRTWDRVRLAGERGERVIPLHDYTYKMIRGIDLYRFCREELAARGQVDFVQGKVEGIEDGGDGVLVRVSSSLEEERNRNDPSSARSGLATQQTYRGRWAFDSRFRLAAFAPDPSRHHDLRQHFCGWWIESPSKVFDPRAATLFDFRGQQELSFGYVLPLSEQQALVEHVLIGHEAGDSNARLKAYVEDVLGIKEYRILAKEGGVNPLTDYVFPRRVGAHSMTIGTPGGRIKPTTGYAFMRIQEDSAAITQSLLRNGTPFAIQPGSRYYRMCDSLMLQLMDRRGTLVRSMFTQLFERNPIGRVFRFLDEAATPWENIALMGSLPPGPFFEAFFRLYLLRQVQERRALWAHNQQPS